MWHTYILECADGTYYCGITNNLQKRISQHNKGKAAKYTRGRIPVILRYAKSHQNRSEASKNEIQLKRLSHSQKTELIHSLTNKADFRYK